MFLLCILRFDSLAQIVLQFPTIVSSSDFLEETLLLFTADNNQFDLNVIVERFVVPFNVDSLLLDHRVTNAGELYLG